MNDIKLKRREQLILTVSRTFVGLIILAICLKILVG
jgi:hypothetical protein